MKRYTIETLKGASREGLLKTRIQVNPKKSKVFQDIVLTKDIWWEPYDTTIDIGNETRYTDAPYLFITGEGYLKYGLYSDYFKNDLANRITLKL